jgi:hypothetical protein
VAVHVNRSTGLFKLQGNADASYGTADEVLKEYLEQARVSGNPVTTLHIQRYGYHGYIGRPVVGISEIK